MVFSPGNAQLRQSLGDLPALTELYFQCSPLSTSSGFQALFQSARNISRNPKQMQAMVVLDELGLADLSPEKPVKVLHRELERQGTAFMKEFNNKKSIIYALSLYQPC